VIIYNAYDEINDATDGYLIVHIQKELQGEDGRDPSRAQILCGITT
jgi:hypothetical protein